MKKLLGVGALICCLSLSTTAQAVTLEQINGKPLGGG